MMPVGSPATVLVRSYNTATVPAPSTNTETVIGSFSVQEGPPPVVAGVPVAAPVRVAGNYNVTPGTASTQIIIRLRQGTTVAGTLVGAGLTFQPVTVGDPITIPFSFQDATQYPQGETAGGPNPYVITVQATSATGNGTSNSLEYEVSA